jgi:multiple sugar transport system permease protein
VACFLAPALIVLGLFFLLPVIAALALSLTDYDLYALANIHNLRFVALQNYWLLLQRPLFWSALGHTVYFVAVGVPLSMGTSLGAAMLLNSPLAKMKPFFRTALFAPVVTTVVAMAVIWRYLFNTKYGMANYVLGHRHPSGRLAGRSALGDADDHPVRGVEELRLQHDHLPGRPAGDSNRPVRGRAHRRRLGVAQFRHITLPMLGPTLLMVSILTVSGYFQLFAEPYVMTEGGPLQSTTSVLYLMYEEGFKWWNLGSASAVAFLLFVIMFAVTPMLRLSRRRS